MQDNPPRSTGEERWWAKAEAGTLTPDDICDALLADADSPYAPPFSADYIAQMRDLMTPRHLGMAGGYTAKRDI